MEAGGLLWDLRRGDADDNRTSPYGRGWRNVIISTALEFNYLTATIAFLVLVIVPLLLVGLAPPLLYTYGRARLDSAALLTTHPFTAITSIAILVALVVWVARPLLTIAVDNFWHLHYSLVFPLFVALRETINVLMERLPGDIRPSDRLDRKRRLATVLAATILASAGLLLAYSIEVLASPGFHDVVMQPWAVVKAGLSNAAILLGLSTTAASLFWMARELSQRKPLRDWTPGAAVAGAPIVRVAHLSDLHVVGERYGYRMECGTHGPSGNGRVQHALDRLRAIHAATPIDCVLVSGDVTDAGTRAEWVEFLDVFKDFPDLRSRVLFVPGNHDVNIVDRTNTGRFDLPWSVSHALRRLRFVVALDDVQGGRVHLVDRGTGRLGLTLREYLQDADRARQLLGLAEEGSWRGRWTIAKAWEEIFPLVLPPSAGGGCGVILLDSNARSHFSATNAVGVIGRSELRRLRRLLSAYPDTAWLIMLHHHVVEYPVGSVKLGDRIALSLMNAPDVLSAISRYASHVVVFHGHRHHDWIGTKGDVVLCSAPSVSLGSVGPDLYRGSFHVNELALTGGGGLRLTSSERVMVA